MSTLENAARTRAGADRGRRTIVSFMRRSGKLDARLARAWSEHSAAYLLKLDQAPAGLGVDPGLTVDRGFLETAFGRRAPLTLEIGSGQGENVVAAAADHPERDYLALEVYEPGLAHTMLLAGKQGLSNLRLARTNATEFISAAGPGALDEAWTFFPDPWPKMKHHKRRLIQPALAADLARALTPGGLWRIATDIDDYALHVHEVMDADPAWRNLGDERVSLAIEHVGKGTAERAAALPHADFLESTRFPGRILTNFERKGLVAGRAIHDLTYQVVRAGDGELRPR
ncbi:tRNA (guanine(46)-N(7))-methyltransferase TrmB [Bifidobacterium actinocoloniiforme]|nr:tRNA (guanine(46)-N(7))-methyltransferase TrmB [Bifidobacterium actinocoloniiforme]AKV55565.1 tRNA (guanine-N7)-methyltransferase [Bifidobacterium actinocoloniiforme DSM 22766]